MFIESLYNVLSIDIFLFDLAREGNYGYVLVNDHISHKSNIKCGQHE